ncbi:MAG TPA: Calx-beta domain-containing protein, partial [Pyrinomonadaceae bacterium]
DSVPATVQVATFITFDNTKTAASFTATINWGDGTAPSAGSVSANGSGGFNVTGTHTFTAAGNYNTTIQIADDSGNFASGTGTAVVVPTVSVNDVSVNEGDSGTRSLTFTVTLSSPSSSTVTVDYATAAGTATAGVDYQSASGTLIFSPGDTTKNLSINVFGDTANEADETFFFNISNAVNATIVDAQGVGTILNDDAPVLLIDPNTGRAVALDSVTMTADPFSLTNPFNLDNQDHRRRVSLFVWRLGLLPTDTAANVTVTAEDGVGGVYSLAVEYVGAFTPVDGLTQIVVRLPDSINDAPGDLSVKVQLHGPASNSAIIKTTFQ